MKNRGFTLAETLIVLCLIGVLATMMITSFNKSTPDKRKVLFKKAYSVAESVVGELVNDESLYPFDPNRIGFKNTDKVTLEGTTEEYGGTGENAKSKFPKLFERKLNVVESNVSSAIAGTTYTWFTASNGISYSFNGNFVDSNQVEILVDVDGLGNGGNTIGQDVLRILVNFDGKVSVPSSPEEEMLESDAATNS